jgi:hypothetical protein
MTPEQKQKIKDYTTHVHTEMSKIHEGFDKLAAELGLSDSSTSSYTQAALDWLHDAVYNTAPDSGELDSSLHFVEVYMDKLKKE